MLGFRYPFCNGSFDVSNKGLRNPNRPFNVLMRRTNKAGDFNPSYVLCRASDGHVYAKFVGSPHEYIEWSIWVPKTLVTNIKGPIIKWVPKTKH